MENTLISANAMCKGNVGVLEKLEALHRIRGENRRSPFIAQIERLNGHLKGIEVLRSRVANSIALLSHGLDLRNQKLAAAIDKHILDLTRHTADDSMTVKIITVVSLLYLPGEFVAVGHKTGTSCHPPTANKAITDRVWHERAAS